MNQPFFFGNQGYSFERLPRKLITIELDATSNSFNRYVLFEPLIIDKLSDIYIDSFITNKINATSSNDSVFIMDVSEFSIKAISNDAKYNNKIIIPNNGADGAETTTIGHRSGKFNYVASINPTTLSELNIQLKSQDEGVIGDDVDSQAFVTFMFVARD